MNNLSWLIIMADILPSVSWGLCFGAFALLVFFGAFWLDGLIEDNTKHSKIGRWTWLFLALWFSSWFIPSKSNTYYAIAASEIGEEVVTSETGNKALRALDNWLESHLSEEEETS